MKIHVMYFLINEPPNSLMDSTMSPKVKTTEGEGVGVHSLVCSTSDTPPSFLMDSTASPRVKTTKGEKVGVCSLARNTLGVKGYDEAPRWD